MIESRLNFQVEKRREKHRKLVKRKKVKLFALFEVIIAPFFLLIAVIVFQVMYALKNDTLVGFKCIYEPTVIINQYGGEKAFWELIILLQLIGALISISTIIFPSNSKILDTGMMEITKDIKIPVPAGNGQYGRAHFLDMEELLSLPDIACYAVDKEDFPRRGGLVIGIKAIGKLPKKCDEILYMPEDRHFLMVGATRSGKSRRYILESIWFNLLSGRNIFVTDPKGELYIYTHPFAEKMGYKRVVIDLREPLKGDHYNYMQEILDALDREDVADAIDYTWDLVAILVGEQKGEPIWYNGESAAIAASILIVAIDAPPEFRNLTNVYYFLAFMAQPDEFGNAPINDYLKDLPDDHPAKAVFAMANIAHTKTRGSFFSSALGTLKYFTNPKVSEMTSRTDYKFEEMVSEKTIVYLIIPDEKTTLYPLASIYIMQFYTYLVKAANLNGGRCPIDWIFLLDEFGQMPYIPQMPQFTSVGAGRGICLVLSLQEFQQLKRQYKDDFNTIKNNCDTWIYLKCSIEETQKEFSQRLGTYTVQSNSTNVSNKGIFSGNGNYSNSANLISRQLLFPNEVGKIEAPYALISMAGKDPLMLIAPDLSYYKANKDFGMGDKEHNKKLFMERSARRRTRSIQNIPLWGIWKSYAGSSMEFGGLESEGTEENQRISFL